MEEIAIAVAGILAVPLLACSVLLWSTVRAIAWQNKILVKVVSAESIARANWVDRCATVQRDPLQWKSELVDETDRSFGRLDYESTDNDETDG